MSGRPGSGGPVTAAGSCCAGLGLFASGERLGDTALGEGGEGAAPVGGGRTLSRGHLPGIRVSFAALSEGASGTRPERETAGPPALLPSFRCVREWWRLPEPLGGCGWPRPVGGGAQHHGFLSGRHGCFPPPGEGRGLRATRSFWGCPVCTTAGLPAAPSPSWPLVSRSVRGTRGDGTCGTHTPVTSLDF